MDVDVDVDEDLDVHAGDVVDVGVSVGACVGVA